MELALYLLVTADEYELPVFEGTAKEIATLLGMKKSSLSSSMIRNYKLRYGNEKLYCRKISDRKDKMEEEN